MLNFALQLVDILVLKRDNRRNLRLFQVKVLRHAMCMINGIVCGYARLSMVMYGYLWLCMAIYGYVWLCMYDVCMHGFVCMALYAWLGMYDICMHGFVCMDLYGWLCMDRFVCMAM